MAIDIIYGERVTTGVDARETAEPASGRRAESRMNPSALWLKARDLERVTGWVHKPEGFCKANVCIPVPASRKSDFVSGDRFNLAALAGLLGRPVVADAEHRVWYVGEGAADRKRSLTSLDAPDFTLPDLAGRMHSLSDHRGKKVFLVSWASW